MKRALRRLGILLLIFVMGVTVSALLLNNQTTDDRSDMNDSALPEVMVQFGSTAANRMYGYREKMETDYVRESITPLDTSKQLTFLINPYDSEVNSLSYEIRTSDGSKVMENQKIRNLTEQEDGYLEATINISSDLKMNQEYSLQITLDTDDGEAYYYTRVVSRSSVNTESYVSFVYTFVESCLDKDAAEDISVYLDSESSSSTNLYDIDISSGLSNISWGSLNPQIYMAGFPVIREINETTASISMEYLISAENSEGQTEIYYVTEFYRMRYTETRIMLLDFERSAERMFDGELSVISGDGLILGVGSTDVNYAVNEDASVVAFVRSGELWSYSPDNGKIVKIYSFCKEEDSDFRDIRNEHDIKIVRVEDNGDVDFVVYGYMNRGDHEGLCGVSVCHYSNDQNAVEEKVFIPSTRSYDFLKEDMGRLSYINSENQLFVLFGDELYQVDIEEGTAEVIADGILTDNLVVSDTNAHAAWLIQEGEDAGKVLEIDFDTLETRLLSADEGQVIRPLGFMNEDLVYGLIQEGDILTDANGHVTEGITTLRIESFEGEVKKEYHEEGLYITDVSVGSMIMEFELSVKSDGGYTVQGTDNITNNSSATANLVTVDTFSDSRTGRQVELVFEDAPADDEPLVLSAKLRTGEEQVVAIDITEEEDTVYYVYAKGGLNSVSTDPAEAILTADDLMGVVLNREQQYVWERGNKKTQIQLNVSDIPAAMLSGSWDQEALQEALGEEGTILDLTGCSLDSVLYEVSAQRPVIAKTGDDTCTVIVGYDDYNTYLYDVVTGETSAYGMNDSTTLFAGAGNVFITYIENTDY
ncbi:MAG: hypothetical protein LUF78_07275 [Clostridiales bacterium]|nr:hypothetical protein [Clostridiales bacterium]